MGNIRKAISNPRAAFDHIQYHGQRKVGKLLFNINRPASQVAAGKIARKKSEVFSDPSINRSNEEIDSLRRCHHLEVGKIYKDEVIESLRKNFETYLEESGPTYTLGLNGVTYSRGIDITESDAKKHFPELQEIINGYVSDLLRGYYQSYFKPVRIDIKRTRHIPPEVVSESDIFSNYWHFDGSTTDHIKLFVYLSDVSEDHGPFHHITEPESRKIANDSFARSEDGVPNGKIENMSTVQTFTGPKGSAALCNTTKILHRAGIPSDGNTRDMLQFMFAPAKKPLKENWVDNLDDYNGLDTRGVKRLLHY